MAKAKALAPQQKKQLAKAQAGGTEQQYLAAHPGVAAHQTKVAGGALPQPPAADQGQQGTAGYYQYDPTAESQLNQPYQDVLAAGNLAQLPSQYGRMESQGQLGDIYGQGAAQNLGGAAAGMQPMTQMGGQAFGLGQGSLGQYGQLMDPNYQIQQGLAGQIQAIQSGKTDVDPAMLQQFDQQQRDLQAQLQRQLGPDWASSSAGIEAMGRFNQGKQTALGSANFNRLQGLVGMQQGGMNQIGNAALGYGQFGQGVQGQQFGQGAQLGTMYGQNSMDLYNQGQGLRGNQLAGAGQMLNNLGQIQQLYGNIPQTMGQFGQAMSGQAGAAVGAQGPYQQDRLAQLGASYAPTSGQYAGMMMGQSGNRYIQSASAMSGGSGGGGGNPFDQGAKTGYV